MSPKRNYVKVRGSEQKREPERMTVLECQHRSLAAKCKRLPTLRLMAVLNSPLVTRVTHVNLLVARGDTRRSAFLCGQLDQHTKHIILSRVDPTLVK